MLSTLPHLSEEASWARSLANRLRLIQASFPDDPATRQGYLRDEIKEHIKDVTPSKQRVYLEALKERFPSWDGSEGAPATRSTAAEVPETPETLLDKLLELSANLPPDVRAAMSRRLQAAGFSISQGGGGLPELSPEVQKKLGLSLGQQLNAERTVKLLTGLADTVLALDQLVWTLWKQIYPKSAFRKEGDVAKLIGPYLSGDPEVATQVLAQPLERTRKLIAALLGATGRAGSAFARKYTEQFSPERIEGLAGYEKKIYESIEYAAWRKYREIYKERANESALEAELLEAIGKAAEAIIGRSAG